MGKQVFFAVLISTLFASCSRRESLFNVNATMDFVITLGLSTLESHSILKERIPVPISLSMDNLNLSAVDVEEVVAQRAFLRPKFGDLIDLDFINSVKISMIDQTEFRSREIFFMDFVPFGSKTEIELMPALTNIQDFVINDKAVIEITLQFRQFPPQTFEMDADMTFAGFAKE